MKLHKKEQDVQDEPARPGPRRIGENEEPRKGAPGQPVSRSLLWAILAAALLLIFAIASQHFDEFLRRTLEAKINQRLHGYSVTLGGAHLSPFNLSLTLRDGVIRQQAHPDPPVAAIPRLTASVEWKELLRFHLVANAVFDRPRVHVNLPQLREEDKDEMDVEDRGWQDALQSIYPLKFNLIQVREGEIVYVDEDPKRPFEITHWNLSAENIRNVRSTTEVYPSPVRTEGVIFETGRGVLEGHMDFLSEPHPGIHALYKLEKVPLERLGMFSSRANLELEGGVLDSNGELEYGVKHQEAHIEDVTIHGLKLDYVHTAATAGAEKERAAQAAEAVQDDNAPMPVKIDRFRLNDSVVGLVNRNADDPYRLFVSDADLTVTNISSGFKKGPAVAKLTGKFMGSGTTRSSATFREDNNGPDFDLAVAIEGASLPSMNDLLRSYGKLDVVKGTFSVYSEVSIQNRRITGYVKPLIKDVDVYDSEQDKKKPVLKKIYEKIAGGLSHILENEPREEVATVVDLSGTLDDPDSSAWEVVVRLVSNAFVKAILPGFDREMEKARKD
ncbi:MAG TPA: DUF748 domain-containing protein, partial [Thermoanaerobaculia bacterium]|nr:DUF748 domain-containing protein [Thermoanaerobaculia bacterium]